MSMMNLWIALALVLPSMGCTHHRRVTVLPRDLLGEPLEVKRRDGKTTKARAERTPRGIIWRTGKGSTVPWRHLRQVTEVSHGRGALDWLGIGLAAGVSAGVVLGLTADDTCGDPNVDVFCLRKQDIMLLAGGVLGGAFGVVGPLFGAGLGARMVYEIDGPDGPEVRPGGPPGSAVGASLASESHSRAGTDRALCEHRTEGRLS